MKEFRSLGIVFDDEYNPVYVPRGLPKVPGALNTTALAAKLLEDIKIHHG